MQDRREIELKHCYYGHNKRIIVHDDIDLMKVDPQLI